MDDDIVDALGEVVGSPVGDTPEQAAANGRMQAAAPELFVALEAVFAKLDDGRDAPGHSHDVAGVWDSDNAADIAGRPCEWCAQWAAARAAIAKARGEQ